MRPWPLPAFALLALAACTVGPDYERPEAETPPAFKEAEGWKPAQPADTAPRGPWWAVYNDQLLDSLEQQVEVSNQNLKASEAAFRQARAIVHETEATLFPVVSETGTAQRSGAGGGSNFGTTAGGVVRHAGNQFTLTTTATWEIDIWGRIRRQVESNVASAQASAADLANAQLSAQAELASDYLQLRITDQLKKVLDDNVEQFRLSLVITQNRYRSGVAARSDVASAQAQLDGTRAQAIAVGVQRAAFEHAIAVLIGKPPAEFSIAPDLAELHVPDIPVSVPSTLLERRPDIAGNERLMQSANALVGVAIAAYYPTVSLSGSYGFSSSQLGTLLEGANSLWAVGGSVAETLLDFGQRAGQVEAARAFYDQSVANYRQTVLTAFQQVEDQMAALRILEQEDAVQRSAVKSAEEAVQLFINQYKAGTVAYTSVTTAQTTALGDEEAQLNILQSRLVASVSLIEALGGGWDAAQLPNRDQLDEGRQYFP
jgi:NodT family efflux transporter outer membrane factor (OMF) lipoprotein